MGQSGFSHEDAHNEWIDDEVFERLLFRKVYVWVLIAAMLIGTILTIMFGWAVVYKSKGGERGGPIGDLLLTVATIPDPLMKLIMSPNNVFQPQIISFDQFSGFKLYDPLFVDEGTLLVSSFDSEKGVTTVYLYDIKNNERLFEWVPPVDEINANSSYSKNTNKKKNYRTQHPLLMDNGDLIFTSGEGPLVRIDKCGNLKWVVDRHFHHSIEVASSGNLFVPHVMAKPTDKGSVTTTNHIVAPIRDDGIAEVSPDGEIVNEWSVKGILERHGYQGLLYGVGAYQVDRIHLNDIEPILESDDYVEKGDLVLSVRHLSTVFLYRPSTDEIVWLKTGPWLNQHDVDYQGNGVFSVFGNDALEGPATKRSLRGYSTIWSYDQKDGSVTAFQELEDVGIFTHTEGLHSVLSNGDIFIEEQNSHILHRVNGPELRWSYVNALGDGKIGALHWSRYLSLNGDQLGWIDQASCL